MTSHLVGLIGSGIGPSLSPALHERAADHHGLRYLYRTIDIADLGLGADAAGCPAAALAVLTLGPVRVLVVPEREARSTARAAALRDRFGRDRAGTVQD